MIKQPKVFPMQKHTELINYVAEIIKAKYYLEIGVYDTGHNFDRIYIDNKLSIDPDPKAGASFCMISDKYFEDFTKLHDTSLHKFDIVFIDGLHHADQVKKDIENSWSCLRDGGVIILHDTNPHSEKITCVPRGNQREWTGDVYRTICQIESPDIITLDDDYGVTILRKTKGSELHINDLPVSWEEFDLFRKDFLNLKSWDEITAIIDKW